MVAFTKAENILITPDRQRKDFDPEALVDLENSLLSHGLMHPIVVREVEGTLVLVAGERRLRAIQNIFDVGGDLFCNNTAVPPGCVPYVTLGELDPLDAEEAELHENLRREDLSWAEESAAISRLHKLREAQATRIGGVHKQMDTYKEAEELLGISDTTRVRQGLLIADHLNNPAIAKAKSTKEAFKILKKEEQRQYHEALSERVGKKFNSSIHELHHINCLDWLKTCPDNTFDVILTDPPYGMNAQDFQDAGGTHFNAEHQYTDDIHTWRSLMDTLCPELFRCAKPQAHSYIFCDIDNFHELKLRMQAAGWYVFRTPLVNHKPRSGRIPLPDLGPKRQYELCLYAIKGKRPTTGVYSDVISTVLEENLTHGAQKPVELYVNLLRRSIRPGDVVLDAFAGTGTIFPAAHQLRCRAVGLEISKEYYGIAVERLNSLDDQPEMV